MKRGGRLEVYRLSKEKEEIRGETYKLIEPTEIMGKFKSREVVDREKVEGGAGYFGHVWLRWRRWGMIQP